MSLQSAVTWVKARIREVSTHVGALMAAAGAWITAQPTVGMLALKHIGVALEQELVAVCGTIVAFIGGGLMAATTKTPKPTTATTATAPAPAPVVAAAPPPPPEPPRVP